MSPPAPWPRSCFSASASRSWPGWTRWRASGQGRWTRRRSRGRRSTARRCAVPIPAAKGFEIGSGFAGTLLRGSAHNDPFCDRGGGRLGTLTNRSGGVQGGIANGETIRFRVAFKPVATIGLPQRTADYAGRPVVLEACGRHDPCVLPRAVPVVEAMAALALADAALAQAMQIGGERRPPQSR